MYLLDFLPNGKAPTKAEKKNPLLTDAAQTMLTMGYLPKVIKIAVERVLLEKGREQISQYRLQAKWIFTAWLCITSQVSLYIFFVLWLLHKTLYDGRVEGTLLMI